MLGKLDMNKSVYSCGYMAAPLAVCFHTGWGVEGSGGGHPFYFHVVRCEHRTQKHTLIADLVSATKAPYTLASCKNPTPFHPPLKSCEQPIKRCGGSYACVMWLSGAKLVSKQCEICVCRGHSERHNIICQQICWWCIAGNVPFFLLFRH